ncbi:MAG: hypothetical protein ACE5GS_15315 [Kiloniellaceae bacterium]
MAQLEQATRRLQAALDQLERALDAPPGAPAGGAAKLRQALDAAQRENAALQDVAETVAARLDSTIARLKSTLES